METSRFANLGNDAFDKPIIVVARIQFIRFNNELAWIYHDYTSNLT